VVFFFPERDKQRLWAVFFSWRGACGAHRTKIFRLFFWADYPSLSLFGLANHAITCVRLFGWRAVCGCDGRGGGDQNPLLLLPQDGSPDPIQFLVPGNDSGSSCTIPAVF